MEAKGNISITDANSKDESINLSYSIKDIQSVDEAKNLKQKLDEILKTKGAVTSLDDFIVAN